MSELGREQRRRNRLRHGLYTMQKAVAVLGSRAFPGKSAAVGRELRAWRESTFPETCLPQWTLIWTAILILGAA